MTTFPFVRKTALMLALVLASIVSAAPALAVNTKAGIAFPLSEKSPMPVKVTGKLMTVEGKVWSGTGGLGGGERIHFDAKIRNASTSNSFYSIEIAFFDKSWNLIAAHGFTQIFGQAPGKTDNHSADMYIPEEEFSKIAAFQVTFYDDTSQIGK